MREEGLNTPQFAFHTGDGTDGTNKLAAYFYKNLYSTGKYRELWFMWDGKPLMLGNSTQLSAQYRNVFTFRRSWAWQSGENQFPWLDNTPQGRCGKRVSQTGKRICWQTGSNQCMFGATCNYKQRQELFGRRRACKCIGGNHAWTDKLSWAVGACTFTWSRIYLCNGMERMGCFQLLRSWGAGFSGKKTLCQWLLFRWWIQSGIQPWYWTVGWLSWWWGIYEAGALHPPVQGGAGSWYCQWKSYDQHKRKFCTVGYGWTCFLWQCRRCHTPQWACLCRLYNACKSIWPKWLWHP